MPIHEVIVVSKHKGTPNDYTPVYIGRGSKLGNPYPIDEYNSREFVCDKYEALIRKEWVEAMAGNEPSKRINELICLTNRVKAGEKIALQCFCKPKQCHGDFLAKILNWYASK